MRSIYSIPIKEKVIIEDHWDFPFRGGILKVVENSGYVVALELVYEKQPIENSPHVDYHNSGEVSMTITNRDHSILFVKRHLEDVSMFIECLYNVKLSVDDMEVRYEGETPEEEAEIIIKRSSTQKRDSVSLIPFDIITRAAMASEKTDGPRFEATLYGTARRALSNKEFINSFRYSFLLIESIYGRGQFKKVGLQKAMKNNEMFRSIIDFSIKDAIRPKNDKNSDTATLLSNNPSIDDVIDHLIEKRGYYFHGNIERKNPWHPDNQKSAISLALLAISISGQIAMIAAGPLFEKSLERKHFEIAMDIGAKTVFEITYKFQDLEEKFEREKKLNIVCPGVIITSKKKMDTAQKCLEIFNERQPASKLISATCIVKGTEQIVFDIVFRDIDNKIS